HAHGWRSGSSLGQGREAVEHDGVHRQESAARSLYQGAGTMFGAKAVKKLAAKATKTVEAAKTAEATKTAEGAKTAEERPAKKSGLSESELLRAPAAHYMNAEQLAFFRERLLAMQKELLEKADLTS